MQSHSVDPKSSQMLIDPPNLPHLSKQENKETHGEYFNINYEQPGNPKLFTNQNNPPTEVGTVRNRRPDPLIEQP